MMLLSISEIHSPDRFKPSKWIDGMSRFITTTYRYFGRFISDLSSFYRILGLEELVSAFIRLMDPIQRICIAPIKSTFCGYFTEVDKYRSKYVILAGTLSIGILVWYGYLDLNTPFLMLKNTFFDNFSFQTLTLNISWMIYPVICVMMMIMMIQLFIIATSAYPDNDEIKRRADGWNVPVDKCRNTMDHESKDP
jgi:hypothetical protein